MRALVTGATGFVGQRLLEHLQEPVVLTRNVASATHRLSKSGARCFAWDPQNAPAPVEAFNGIDTVFHLAGEPLAEGRWTAAKRARLRDSRIVGTRHLVETLARLQEKPRVLVSASAVGYYGSRGDDVLTESSGPQHDFLAEICIGWEQEAAKACEVGVRVVPIRTGIVLGDSGGALAKMLTPFRLGVGGILGNGTQWMSWIHVDDLVQLLLFAARTELVGGPLNGTSPNPATNYDFTKTLGKVLGRPTILPMPGFMLRIVFGEFASVLLGSQRAVPRAATEAGFQFRFPELEPALRQILSRS